MKKFTLFGTKINAKTFFGMIFVLVFSAQIFAQEADTILGKPTVKETTPKTIKVTQINDVGLKTLLKPNGKPLLVNFWATWCEPCREEFPDLVKIDNEFRGKIDFITVSLDDVADIGGDVPKFLQTMKAEMPAYLLKARDESEVIASIAKDWQGGLPFTILYRENGEISYFRQGKVKLETLRAEIDKSFQPKVK